MFIISFSGEFWLGLEKIHLLSKDGNYILKVQLSDWRDELETVKYPFRLSGEESNYSLHILDNASRNLESALATDPAGLPFSTRDKDNDQKSDINCAKHLSGNFLSPKYMLSVLSWLQLMVFCFL